MSWRRLATSCKDGALGAPTPARSQPNGQAKAAGAETVIDIADQDHGGRAYTCRDPEGHVWNFGDYDPWQDR